MGAYDFLFTGDQSGSQTTTGTPGAWDPDLKQIWDEYLAKWQEYQDQTDRRADYLTGVNADYAGRMNAAQDQYTRPTMTVSIGGQPLDIVPRRNLAALELLGSQYGDMRTAATETPPNQGYFDYLEALAPQAWRGMQNRYALPTETETGDLSRTPSALEMVGNLARLGYTGAQLWDLFGGKDAQIDAALTDYFRDLDFQAATTVSDGVAPASEILSGSPGGSPSVPSVPTPSASVLSSLADKTPGVDAALTEFFAPIDAEATNIGVDAALGDFFGPLDAAAGEMTAAAPTAANAGTMASGAYPGAYWAVPVAQALYGANIVKMHQDNNPNYIGGSKILDAAQGRPLDFARGDGKDAEVKIQTDGAGNRWLYDPWATETQGRPVWYNLDDPATLAWARTSARDELATAMPGNVSGGNVTGEQRDQWNTVRRRLDPTGLDTAAIEEMVRRAYMEQAPTWQTTGLGR